MEQHSIAGQLQFVCAAHLWHCARLLPSCPLPAASSGCVCFSLHLIYAISFGAHNAFIYQTEHSVKQINWIAQFSRWNVRIPVFCLNFHRPRFVKSGKARNKKIGYPKKKKTKWPVEPWFFSWVPLLRVRVCVSLCLCCRIYMGKPHDAATAKVNSQIYIFNRIFYSTQEEH